MVQNKPLVSLGILPMNDSSVYRIGEGLYVCRYTLPCSRRVLNLTYWKFNHGLHIHVRVKFRKLRKLWLKATVSFLAH